MRPEAKIALITSNLISHTDFDIEITLTSGIKVVHTAHIGTNVSELEIAAAVKWINDVVSNVLVELNPKRQKELDKIISELSVVHSFNTIPQVTGNVSCALALVGALSQESSFSEHISRTFGISEGEKEYNSSLVFPLIINNKDKNPGSFTSIDCIAARSKTSQEAVLAFAKVKNTLELLLKNHGIEYQRTQPNGYLSIEQFIQNSVLYELSLCALHEAGFSYNHDLFIGVDVNSAQITTAGKYTLNDVLEPMDGPRLEQFFEEFIEAYNPLMLIDPFEYHDIIQMRKLHENKGHKTLIGISNTEYDSLNKLKHAHSHSAMSLFNCKIESCHTITEVFELARAAQKDDVKVMVEVQTQNDLLFEIAKVLNVEFIKIHDQKKYEKIDSAINTPKEYLVPTQQAA